MTKEYLIYVGSVFQLSRWAEENQNIFRFVKWLKLNHNNALSLIYISLHILVISRPPT